EAAAGLGGAECLSYSRDHGLVDVFAADALVMAGQRQGAYRAAGDAEAAAAVPEVEAGVAVVGVGACAWLQRQVGDHAAAAMCDPPGGDEGVIEAEGSQACGICGMPLRPG